MSYLQFIIVIITFIYADVQNSSSIKIHLRINLTIINFNCNIYIYFGEHKTILLSSIITKLFQI